MKQKPEHHRQQFARQGIAVLLLALLLTGCGTSKELRRYAMMPALEKRPTTSKASTSGNARTRYSSSDMNYNPPPPFYGTSTTFAASRVYIDPQYHFGDINSTQLSAARKYGITPLANRQEAAEMEKLEREYEEMLNALSNLYRVMFMDLPPIEDQ